MRLLLFSVLLVCFSLQASAQSEGDKVVYLQASPQYEGATVVSRSSEAVMIVDTLTFLNAKEIKTAIGYPQAAKTAGMSGKVSLWVYFDENGKATDFAVLESSAKIFEEAVLNHIMKLKAAPFVLDGKPSKAIGRFEVEFQP